MITTIAKRFTFDAAHCLPLLPDGHKCKRMHGHTYEVEIVLRGKVDPASGMLLDYADIATSWSEIHEAVDHRVLNEVPGLEVPTTENLVAWIIKRFYDDTRDHEGGFWTLLHSVRVKESSTTWCEMSKVEWLAFCGPNS